MRSSITRFLVLLALLAGAGCELSEITAAEGEDLLVVEAVLRAGEPRQGVLLHRSLQGRTVRGETEARVSVVTPEGAEVVLSERPLRLCTRQLAPENVDSLTIEATCYSTRDLEVRPGEAYELRVETLDGRVLRGRTRVPGDFEFRVPRLPGMNTCALDADANLEIVWSPAEGTWSYLAALEITGLKQALEASGIEAPEMLELTGLAISRADTTLVLPREFGIFERFDADQELLRRLQDGFPPGVRMEVAVVAADRNFVNGVRGGGFNPSGEVRISSVIGDGVGVFGSLVPRRFFIQVGDGAPDLPSCLPGRERT